MCVCVCAVSGLKSTHENLLFNDGSVLCSFAVGKGNPAKSRGGGREGDMYVYCIWVFWLLQFLYVSYVLHYSIFRVWCIVGLQCAHSIQCGERATGKRGSKFPLMCAVPAVGGRDETGWKVESMTVADQSQKKDYVWKQRLKIKWNTLKYIWISLEPI